MKDLDKKDIKIDWKKFGSIDLKRLGEEIRTNNSVLNEFGSYVAFCGIEEEFDTRDIDQNFVKLFKCSQVLIEFLLNEFNRFRCTENERKSQTNLIRENKKLRKLLEIQQKAMTYSRTFNGDNVQCPHCPKVFFDSIFLKTHLTRRHPNESLDSEGMLSLTNKINDYQKVLIGDNQSLDKMKTELSALTEKLAKTETNFVQEREERIKLEERIEYIMKIRDKELQQTIKEELEEFKFVQRERDIQNAIHVNQMSANDNNFSNNYEENEEQNHKILEMNKIEEIIAIQAKEMIKLGNNVQKLVSHLTDNSEDTKLKSLELKAKQKHKIFDNSFKQIKSQEINRNIVKKELKTIEDKERRNSEEDLKRVSESVTREQNKTIDNNNRETLKIIDTLDEVNEGFNEKLISIGINVKSNGITEEEYSEAIEKLEQQRDLLIQQNRFDYDFKAVEQQIRQFVDKKVDQRINGTNNETKLLTVPKVTTNVGSEKSHKTIESNKMVKHSVEAIVHSSPSNDPKESDINQNSNEEIESKQAMVENTTDTEIRHKPVLKSIISEPKTSGNNEIKAKERRIRFSETRIEHQISPIESSDDTSEDTSEEYGPVVEDSVTNGSVGSKRPPMVPIPAQRTRKTELNVDQKTTDDLNDDCSEDTNYEIDDQMMDEILQTKTFGKNEDITETNSMQNQNISRQTKVQELAEMIEQQLNKRSAAHKKPPIGSVNVMTKLKTNNSDSDSDY